VKNTISGLAEDLQGVVDNVVFVSEVDSTHATAIRLMAQLDEEEVDLEATLLVAGRQTTGIGRGTRTWKSPAGGLYVSWIRSGLSPKTIGRLPMMAAAAAHTALVEVGVTGVGIKWPNDILADGKKLAGILVHARQGATYWATVGLGVNLQSAPALDGEAAQPATALAELIEPAPYERWCRALVTGFALSLGSAIDDPEPAIDTWRNALIHHRGDTLTVRMASGEVQTGRFNGLTDEGFLRLGQGDDERIITGGDVIEQG
jgi:BirA family biotin operon repressor/biotin-[acetyl-CoA-carboxylase] ligase